MHLLTYSTIFLIFLLFHKSYTSLIFLLFHRCHYLYLLFLFYVRSYDIFNFNYENRKYFEFSCDNLKCSRYITILWEDVQTPF